MYADFRQKKLEATSDAVAAIGLHRASSVANVAIGTWGHLPPVLEQLVLHDPD